MRCRRAPLSFEKLSPLVFLHVILLTLTAPADAQAPVKINPSGGVFAPVDDSLPRQCININTSVVSMFLLDVKARQNTSWLPKWLVSTADLGVKINITLLDPLSQNPSFTFPRAVKLKPVGSSNIVTLPLLYPLLTKFSFVNNANGPSHPISNVSMDIDFINIEKSGALATVMSSLIDFSKSLPVPPNPYSAGVQLFGQFANNLIQQAAAGSADDTPIATVSYDLSNLDTCGPRELMEGTTALLFDYQGNDTTGVIATADVTKYCLFLGSNNQITYALKPQPAADCAHQTGMAAVPKTQLNNPQVVFSVNSYLKQGAPAAVRQVPTTPSLAAHALNSDVIRKEAQSLVQTHFGYDANQATAQKNIQSWNAVLEKGVSALPSDLGSVNEGVARLPASRAIEYDTARSLARCQRVGIAENQCL
jgi:hypothetical protein